MNKFTGNIGFVETVETEPGYWEPQITEKFYLGDWIKFSGKFRLTSDSTNDEKDIASTLSIVLDPWTFQHSSCVRYIEFMGAKWSVTAIEPQHPRLLLTIGGLYNGGSTQAETAE